MSLELLPNELLLNLFQYFNITHLFRAFYGLNIHFNKLLFFHFQVRGYFNFESISKTHFDIICQQYLRTLIDHVISIRLSDNNGTPQQINHFLSYGFLFHQFTYLKFLSLGYIGSEQIMYNIIIDLQHLHHLTHLKIDKCQVDDDLINNGWIFNQIWSLPKLTHCHFERKQYLWNPFFISPQNISLSIKYLYLEGFCYNSNELHRLFEHTINLENLTIDIEHNYDYQEILFDISSMKKLKIFVQYSPHITNNLLKNLPNLTHLTIELAHIVIDGYQWEQIINNHLFNLKIFHFKMEFYLRSNNEKEEQVNQLLDSFRSQFWIIKHQWYIQCHWYLSNKLYKAYLYTLPYYYKDFSINSDVQFKSTCPNHEIHWSYNNVHNLFFIDSINSSVRFPNLYSLKLHLPFDDSFWSIVPNFNKLISLNIKLSKIVVSQLPIEKLLQRAPCLYSLTLSECLFSYTLLFNLTSSSIRRLCLFEFGCFNEEHCESLIHSSVGIQCEELFITVQERNSIVNLVNGMKNLRVLYVRSQDDKWQRNDDDLSTEDKLIKWLKDCLSKSCIIIRGNTNGFDHIQMWIR
ncbi:unnamed protein product [Rotaria sp. Silwood1]|nr:unnamed protein product [Rotaria sp. Silwood1]